MRGALSAPTLDLMTTLAVSINRPLPPTERIARMVWLVRGADPDSLPPDKPWQRRMPDSDLKGYTPDRPTPPWTLIELRRPQAPPAIEKTPGEAEARYLRSTPFVQADDPRVQAAAREIVGDLADPWAKAQAINRWVHANVAKRLTVGLPSTVDVLMSKSGDCHEHAVLFAGLARSVGIPTRLIAGLMYLEGQMYYHAWPEVWTGGVWTPLDPTLGQAIADAAHFELSEAEDEELVSLGQFIGQLGIDVLALEELE